MKPVAALFLSIALGGCAAGSGGLFGVGQTAPALQVRDGRGQTHPRARPAAGSAIAAPGARTAEGFDTTTAQERREALAKARAPGGEVALGVTIASLGAVGEPGIWLKTPLVRAPAKGRVENPETGTAVAVDLIPLDAPAGAGSRISLAAMRLLGVDLTALPELRVYRVE